MVCSTAGPISTVAISRKRMGVPSVSRTMRSAYWSGRSILPLAKILRERSWPSIWPEGSSTFSFARRARISAAVIWRAAIFSESSQIRMEVLFSPPKLMPPTPERTWRRSLIWRSARLVRSRVERVALERATHMTSWASASCLATMGSLMSSGSLSRTRLMRSRTSWAPISTSRLSSNSTVILLTCSRDSLRRILIPGILLISCSMGSVTSASTSSALAPG